MQGTQKTIPNGVLNKAHMKISVCRPYDLVVDECQLSQLNPKPYQ
jgi:hypothetical protein